MLNGFGNRQSFKMNNIKKKLKFLCNNYEGKNELLKKI